MTAFLIYIMSEEKLRLPGPKNHNHKKIDPLFEGR